MSSKFARAGVAPSVKRLSSAVTRSRRRRSFMMFPLAMLRMRLGGNMRDSELPFQSGQLLQIDRADDVYDRELFWFGGDDQKSGDGVAARFGVDVDVFPRAAGHL